jgi:hypothetical protein
MKPRRKAADAERDREILDEARRMLARAEADLAETKRRIANGWKPWNEQ